ncbi:MAG: hypothetical protein WCJ35_25220 [Planctomycetota bacterium]
MSIKDNLVKAKESIDRWLWKLVGKENAILFHFLRFVLACILLAVLLALAVGIVAVLWKAVLLLIAFIIAAGSYLIVIAVFSGVVALVVLKYRSEERQRLRERELQNYQQKQAEERQRARNVKIRQSLLTVDQKTRNNIETVVASLRRFEHRLELAITPAHYTDLFGDNWVNVREFAESSQGRNVQEVSGLLVEIIILYKQAQDIPWIPENLRRMQGWWGEASRKRKWLSEIVETAQATAPIVSAPMVLEAEVLEEPELLPISEMAVQPPPAPVRKLHGASPIPEMAVQSPPAPRFSRSVAASIPEMAVMPPPAPPKPIVHPPRESVSIGPAPKLSVPPTLEELQKYCMWVN